MSMTDPIADLLTRIRNGARAGKEFVDVPHSRLKEAIARVLVEEGYLEKLSVAEEAKKKWLRVWIRYDQYGQPVVQDLQRVSRPGLRKYVGADAIPLVRRGLGVSVLSTPQGVLSDREARRRRVGGEVLCAVW